MYVLSQYLVRIRWDELAIQARAQIAESVLGMLPEIAASQDEWFLKSQTAALVAEVWILIFSDTAYLVDAQ